jgi:nucleoside-diphosphate-sugar epimerase
MKVFVAGASGAIGLPLVRQLTAAGHEVVGSTRGGSGAAKIHEAGGIAVPCDVFDREQIVEVVTRAAPEVVINQLTSLPQRFEPKKKGFYDANNRIRTEGGDNVIEATAASGASRLITQSISFLYELSGPKIKTEDEPVDRSGMHNAVLSHEQKVLGDDRFEGVVLRYGLLYGPGTWYARDGHTCEEVRKRRLPIVGDGAGISSFVHVDDAASAAISALDRGQGIFNATDDEPAPMNEWLPVLAEALGAKPPRKVPAWLAAMVAGKPVVRQATDGRGASNARFKATTGWKPSHPSWRQGFFDAI